MWDLPGPGIEPVSPALAGGFLTTVPPGKSQGDHYLTTAVFPFRSFPVYVQIYMYILGIFLKNKIAFDICCSTALPQQCTGTAFRDDIFGYDILLLPWESQVLIAHDSWR